MPTEGETEVAAAAEAPDGVRRVLLLAPRLHDTSGGRACTDLALRLDRERFAPVVCCYDGWGPLARELQEAGIEIFPLRRRAGLDPTFPVALAAEIRARRVDVIHSLNARRAYVLGTLGGLLGSARVGVATFRDTLALRRRGMLARVGRLCGEIVGTVVATSEEVRDALLRGRWVPPGKTIVVPDGVNTARFQAEGRRESAREHWEIPPEVPVLGAVLQGSGHEELELLLEAFALVRQEESTARLLVAGVDLAAGPEPEGVLGVGPFGDSPALYAGIDVLCVPFSSRSVPLTLLEGLAAGVPIGASRRPDDAGLPPEGPWAFARVSPPGPQALARGLLELLREPEDAHALARAGRACVQADHSIEENVHRIQALYV